MSDAPPFRRSTKKTLRQGAKSDKATVPEATSPAADVLAPIYACSCGWLLPKLSLGLFYLLETKETLPTFTAPVAFEIGCPTCSAAFILKIADATLPIESSVSDTPSKPTSKEIT